MSNRKFLCAWVALCVISVVSCASATPTPIPPTATPQPTATLQPTATPTERPTLTPTPPSATPTSSTAKPVPPAKWGLEYTTPLGASLKVAEQTRGKSANGNTRIDFVLNTAGLPEGKTFYLWMIRWRISEKPDWGIPVNPKLGNVISLTDFIKGEIISFAIAANDQSAQVFAILVPYPIEATGADRCLLSIYLAAADGAEFLIVASGLDPNEEFSYSSQSEYGVFQGTKKASAQGTWEGYSSFAPSAGKPASGTVTQTIVGKRCNQKVEYEWGKAALKFQ